MALSVRHFFVKTCDPEPHAVLRAFGKVLNNFALERIEVWQYSYLDATAYHLQAGLADLRHLQDFFTIWGDEEIDWEGDKDEAKRHLALCRFSARIAKKLGALADAIEKEVGDWNFEPQGS